MCSHRWSLQFLVRSPLWSNTGKLSGTCTVHYLHQWCSGQCYICELYLCADDLKIQCEVCVPEDFALIQIDINSIGLWTYTWQLPLNICNTQHLHTGHRLNANDLVCNNLKISSSSSVRNLGVLMSGNVTFLNHIDYLVK